MRVLPFDGKIEKWVRKMKQADNINNKFVAFQRCQNRLTVQ